MLILTRKKKKMSFESYSRRASSHLEYLMNKKQPTRGVPKKRCPENMQQIYRRTPIPKCDFNKVASQLC